MGIKSAPQPPCSADLALCDFWLFPKLRDCRYERIEEMKESVKKAIDVFTQEDFHGAFEKMLERYNKCIAAGEDYFEGDWCFMCVLSIKVLIRKKSGNLLNDPLIILKRTRIISFSIKWYMPLLYFNSGIVINGLNRTNVIPMLN